MDWLSDIDKLKGFVVPCTYFHGGWASAQRQRLQLHVFTDASERGYGTVVYLRTVNADGDPQVAFVMSKARVTPLKKVSLLRLELLGCLLGARLSQFILDALQLGAETERYFWTDSMVALGWIKGDPLRWKQFVSNRVYEIQSLTSPLNWKHCPGNENPADLLTRGLLAQPLMRLIWLTGLSWLYDDETSFPRQVNVSTTDSPDIMVEARAVPVLASVVPVVEPLIPFDRWSSFDKTLEL